MTSPKRNLILNASLGYRTRAGEQHSKTKTRGRSPHVQNIALEVELAITCGAVISLGIVTKIPQRLRLTT